MTTLIKIFITLFLVSCNLVPEMRSVFNTSFSSLETAIKESDDNVDKRVVLKYGHFNYSAFSKSLKITNYGLMIQAYLLKYVTLKYVSISKILMNLYLKLQ